MKRQKWYAVAAFIFIALNYLPFIFGVLQNDMDTFVTLTLEGGIVETIGAFSLLASAILFGAAFIRSGRPEHRPDHSLIKRLFFLGLVIVFVFGSGEEVSWGQWLFNFEPPESISETNAQDEFNLHNQEIAEGKTLSALILTLFNLFWLTFAVLIPIAAEIYQPARSLFEKFIPVIPPLVGLPILLSYGIMRGLFIVTGESFRQVHYLLGEVNECNLAVIFVIIAAYIVFEMLAPSTRQHNEPAPATG